MLRLIEELFMNTLCFFQEFSRIPRLWKSGRAADCVCLENRSPARDRGFESLLFHRKASLGMPFFLQCSDENSRRGVQSERKRGR